VRQTAQASTRRRNSPRPGCGSGRSVHSSGRRGAASTIACIEGRGQFDVDAPAPAAFALGQRELEDAVLELGDDALVVDLVGQREAALRTADVGLLQQHAAAGLLFLLLAHLGRDGDEVAVHRDVDVLLLRAGDLGAHLVVLVVLGHVEPDVGGHVALEGGRRAAEAAEEVGHELVEGIVAGQSAHEECSFPDVFAGRSANVLAIVAGPGIPSLGSASHQPLRRVKPRAGARERRP
jgi:hypothetical protein